MIIDFADFTTGGTVVNPPLEDVVLTDKEVYPYTTDTIVKSVSYTRTFDNNNWKGFCVPFDIYIDEDLHNNLYLAYPYPMLTKYNTNAKRYLPTIPKITELPVGHIIKANSPIIFQRKNGITEYTLHGDNRKGYVVLKAGSGKPNINNKPAHVISNGDGDWMFYPVQEAITASEVGAYIIFYVSAAGKLAWTYTPTTAINSYRWIMTSKEFIPNPDN